MLGRERPVARVSSDVVDGPLDLIAPSVRSRLYSLTWIVAMCVYSSFDSWTTSTTRRKWHT